MYVSVIEKWYKKLNFPSAYDKFFYAALENTPLNGISVETYDVNEQDGKKNLLAFLYFCENLQAKYEAVGIGEDILIDTLSDLVRWTQVWSELKGELYLGELSWLKTHMSMQLFKLGRLQFLPKQLGVDIPAIGVKKGDVALTIHIPSGEKLSVEACEQSLEKARNFYKDFFPEIDYKCFICNSWLLDPTLKEILGFESNILQFQNLFTYLFKEKSDSILKYVFKWNTTRENIADFDSSSSFSRQVKRRVLDGKDFYKGCGFIKK